MMKVLDSSETLSLLTKSLREAKTALAKLKFLESYPLVEKFFHKERAFKENLSHLTDDQKIVVYSLIAIGQASFVLGDILQNPDPLPALGSLIKDLLPVETFYAELGGIVGYHQTVIDLMEKKTKKGARVHVPPTIDISAADVSRVKRDILWSIEHLGEMAEIYPVGGAADRLGLKDEQTGELLPAARLVFCGRTLLEHLLTDLQAREFLHYKLYNRQLITPVAMMTSSEKKNHEKIQALCEENHWFGRPKDSFRFFLQPLVPALDLKGRWCLQAPSQLLLKPGGHGVLWKCAAQEGVFDWFRVLGRTNGLVRQINNIIAGVDHGLLAFIGIGLKEERLIGFAGCPRPIKISEGMNVLLEKSPHHFCLTNIEYCDLAEYGIADEPAAPWHPYSKFPSNTNLLFVNFAALQSAIAQTPFPGLLVNAKQMKVYTRGGHLKETEVLRLESTMQNIADVFYESSLDKPLKTYLTYNFRHKTISPIKKKWLSDQPLQETPENCFYDLLKNARELLVGHCLFDVPELGSEVDFLSSGPSFIFLYHPALGPLYSIISQKLTGGRLAKKSELHLQIAELRCENLDLKGSLSIRTDSVLGTRNANGEIVFSDQMGKASLKNVCVVNRGSEVLSCSYWKNGSCRTESCEIFISEGGEFEAENVIFEGDLRIEVPPYTKITAVQRRGKVELISTALKAPSWKWRYQTDANHLISLTNQLA